MDDTKPAPEEILEFTSCGCKKSSCSSNQCQCFALNMKCVGLCSCRNCTNVEDVESEDGVSNSSEVESDEETDTDSEMEDEYLESTLDISICVHFRIFYFV